MFWLWSVAALTFLSSFGLERIDSLQLIMHCQNENMKRNGANHRYSLLVQFLVVRTF